MSDEVTKPEGMKFGVCSNSRCGEKVRLDEDGNIAYHDWPKPTRQVCPGSKKPPKE